MIKIIKNNLIFKKLIFLKYNFIVNNYKDLTISKKFPKQITS